MQEQYWRAPHITGPFSAAPGSRSTPSPILYLALLAGAMMGCGEMPGDENALEDSDVETSAITSSQIMARAKTWVDAGVSYSQYPPYWSGWRRDCSGFVSMAWNLSKPGLSTVTLPNVSYRISKSDLRAGDILLLGGPGTAGDNGHVRLFGGWLDSAHSRYWVYEETPPKATYNEYYWSATSASYPPYRYNQSSGGGGGGGGGSSDCSVHSDGKLYCTNAAGAAIYASASSSSSIVNHLRTTYSWFQCWGTGQLHAGGNTTWYYTLGDDNSNWGWVPGVSLNTPDAFDANPSAKGLARCSGASPPPANSCGVRSDGKLYCTNAGGAAIYASLSTSSAVVNHLRTTYSWFDCWGTGQLHAGGNTTWYHTQGDDNGNWGWVPGVSLNTPDAFDANPSARGLTRCSSTPPTSGCSVHSDGKLYCSNTPGAAMYATAHYSSSVVNHLRTSFSWFVCWGTGDRHGGGNTTWYRTLGDDNSNWGWVPAVDLNTSSAFDANPSASGLPHC